jgi:hypothetical protein
MNSVLRLAHPLFCWLIFVSFGLEAIKDGNLLKVLVLAIGLGGISQTYWQACLGEKRPHKTEDLISFYVGLVPALLYPLVVIWSFFFKH